MESIKAHEMNLKENEYGYRVWVVTDCNGRKIKITQCSKTKQKCEAKKC